MVFFGGYVDTRFECHRESIMKIEEVVRQVEPDTVYTHFGEDTHPDHRLIARTVVPATRSVPNLLFFEALSSQQFLPTVLSTSVPSYTRSWAPWRPMPRRCRRRISMR